jgi:uncharacterized membrane protein
MQLDYLKEELINKKKYFIIYILLIMALTLLMFGPKNYQYWSFEAISIPIITIIGFILILYSFKKNLELHKVALVLIIIFGLIMVFLAPPMSHPDEMNHFTRAELLSEGAIFPEKTDEGVLVSDYYFSLNEAQKGLTILDNPHASDPITDHKGHTETNDSPFYAYIASAIGILFAKCLHLTSVFSLLFARLLNLIVYAGIAYWAIKKAPAFKIGLTLIATMPMAIAQASSVSYDAFIITLTLVIFAYFIKMYKEKAENKDLAIFFISILLISLIKPPYIMLSLLILTIPKENFVKNRNYSFIAIILIFIATILSFSNFLTPALSTAASASANNISSSAQLAHIINNPLAIFGVIKNSIALIPDTFVLNSSFFHYADFKGLKIFKLAYIIFFLLFALLYKQDINMSRKNRIILSSIFLITYFGIFFILYLIWTPVGSDTILGVQSRYFIPIIPLLPLIINYKEKSIEEYNYLIMIIITFLVGLVLLTITHYY